MSAESNGRGAGDEHIERCSDRRPGRRSGSVEGNPGIAPRPNGERKTETVTKARAAAVDDVQCEEGNCGRVETDALPHQRRGLDVSKDGKRCDKHNQVEDGRSECRHWRRIDVRCTQSDLSFPKLDEAVDQRRRQNERDEDGSGQYRFRHGVPQRATNSEHRRRQRQQQRHDDEFRGQDERDSPDVHGPSR